MPEPGPRDGLVEDRSQEPSTARRAFLVGLAEAEPSLRLLAQHPPRVRPQGLAWFTAARGRYPATAVHAGAWRGTLWAGRAPGGAAPEDLPGELAALRAGGLQRLVCLVPQAQLAEHLGLRDYLDTARVYLDEVLALPIPARGVPGDDMVFDAAVRGAHRALAAGESILVHCVAGCGRTGLFAACALVEAGLGAVEALQRFHAARGCGPESAVQYGYVLDYARRR
ncbi:MAG: protein-tyrosine phosphatase family protein [Pseudomonadota bacterium]